MQWFQYEILTNNKPDIEGKDHDTQICKTNSQSSSNEDSEQRNKSSSEVSMKPKKNLDSLITKVTSPFSVVPDLQK